MKFTENQILRAIDDAREQGFSDDQIIQGAQNNFGIDISDYVAPSQPAAQEAQPAVGGLSAIPPQDAQTEEPLAPISPPPPPQEEPPIKGGLNTVSETLKETPPPPPTPEPPKPVEPPPPERPVIREPDDTGFVDPSQRAVAEPVGGLTAASTLAGNAGNAISSGNVTGALASLSDVQDDVLPMDDTGKPFIKPKATNTALLNTADTSNVSAVSTAPVSGGLTTMANTVTQGPPVYDVSGNMVGYKANPNDPGAREVV